jgi:hypothetical protein
MDIIIDSLDGGFGQSGGRISEERGRCDIVLGSAESRKGKRRAFTTEDTESIE